MDFTEPNKQALIQKNASLKQCIICTFEYDENQRCPRTLLCGHTFCSFCIHQLITRYQKRCPSCRQNFLAFNVLQLGKNIAFIDLLQYVNTLEAKPAKVESESEILERLKQNHFEGTDRNVIGCKITIDHMKTLITNNSDLERNLSQILLEVKGEIKSQLQELEEKCEAKIQYLKHGSEQLKKMVIECEQEEKDLEQINVVLDRAKTRMTADAAIEEAEAVNTAAKNRMQGIHTEVSRNQKIHQGMKQSMTAMKFNVRCIRQSLPLAMADRNGLLENMAALIPCDGNLSQISPEVIQQMNAAGRCVLLHEGFNAVQQLQGKMRFGKLSVSDSKLCLHHFEDRQPFTNRPACTIKFDDVTRLKLPSAKLVFLDFGNDDMTLCRVYIRLSPSSKRAENFVHMCTGEKGPSYSGTKITNVIKAIHTYSIICGDYEKNTGEGGRALVKGCGDERGGSLVRRREVGSVGSWCNGDAYAAQFSITTRVNIEGSHDVQFGMVESGIDILAEATSLYPNMQENFRVTDCGIVLIENVDFT